MKHLYAVGVTEALRDLGIIKVANPEVAAQLAQGASPEQLQYVVDSKITANDIQSGAKVMQVMAEMLRISEEANLQPTQTTAGGPSAGQQPPVGGGSGVGGGNLLPQSYRM